MRKIAVVNRTNLKNYGSVLQVYALCESIRSLGYKPEVVWERGSVSRHWDFRPSKVFHIGLKLLLHPHLAYSTYLTFKEVNTKAISEEKATKFDQFADHYFIRRYFSSSQLKVLARDNEYHKFVCGSDQIWSSTTLYVDPLMYLRFAPASKRVAYAPSLGRDYIPTYNVSIMRKYIKEIPQVSIREEKGRALIKQLTGRDIPVVLDPTLLLSRDKWNELKIDWKGISSYILCYFLDPPAEAMASSISDFAKRNNMPILQLGVRFKVGADVCVDYEDAGPEEFLGLVDQSVIVFTDSYHGMLFSIIYQKPFWSVARNYGQFDQSSRQHSVLNTFGLQNRYITGYHPDFSQEIDYSQVLPILEKERLYSLNYLKNALAH